MNTQKSNIAQPFPNQLLRLEEVKKITCKSKSSIYADIAVGKFPAPLKIGARAIAWRGSDLNQWLENLQPAMEA